MPRPVDQAMAGSARVLLPFPPLYGKPGSSGRPGIGRTVTATPPPTRGSGLRQAGILVLLLVPFAVALLEPGWIQAHEGLSYPMRLVEVQRDWADGHWSARWFPDFYAGEGFPFLSFYAPLLFFLAGLARVAGLSLALSLKLPVLLGALAGAAGAYRLSRLATGRSAAVVAAALWAYAPYRVRDIWIRGDLAEFLAAGLLPWCLLAVLRLGSRRGPRDVVLAAIPIALLVLTHNVLGMLGGALLAATAAIAVAFSAERVRTAVAAAAAGIGGLLLSAFFWAAALWEKRFVQIDAMTTGSLDFRNNFLSIADLFHRPIVPGPTQPLAMSYEIGIPAIVLLVLFPFALRRVAPRARPVVILAVLMLAGGLVMCTRAGWPVYQAVPLLRFVQFPWRFLNFVALGLALCGALGFEAVLGGRSAALRRSVAAGVAVAAVLAVRPLLGPKANFEIPSWGVDPEAIASRLETTTSSEEYLPRWVTKPPMRARDFTNGILVEGDATVSGPGRRAARYDFTVDAAGPVTLTLRDLYFPDWRATADGAPVDLTPREGTGNMQLRLGPGEHEIRVHMGTTPVRHAARLVSVGAALFALVAWWAGGSPRERKVRRGFFSAGPHG